MIQIIVAFNRHRVIGDGVKIPWHIPEDLKLFRRLTVGTACVMGRKTWESIPARFRPLPDRHNIIVSTTITADPPAHVCPTVTSALAQADNLSRVISVIGGGEVYRQCLPMTTKILASEVRGYDDLADGVKFPPCDWPGRVVEDYDKFQLVEYLRPAHLPPDYSFMS